MKAEMVLPLILAVIDLGAAAVYGFKGDWPRAWYWTAACGITSSTLFMK